MIMNHITISVRNLHSQDYGSGDGDFKERPTCLMNTSVTDTKREIVRQPECNCIIGACISSISMSLHPLTVPEGNNGCNGGNMYNSFMYIIFNDGVDTAPGYPYQATVS